MRLYLRRAIISFFMFSFLFGLIKFLFLDKRHNNICMQSEQFLSNLHSLINKAHEILSHHNIIHFLCYKTLWGQIQQSKLLSWADKAELCVALDTSSNINETFVNSFIQNNLQIIYSSSEGKYLVSEPNMPGALVEIIIFKDTKSVNMLHRIGWKHLLLPPNCEWESLDCFPTYLVEPPLSQGMLGKSVIPIPRGGIEIQKYHYRHTWWKKLEKPC